MPIKRRARRTRKVRKYGRRRGRKIRKARGFAGLAPSSLTTVRGLGLPARIKVHLRFSEDTGLTSTGSLVTASYSANGLYDPRIGVGGGQPMYFDQLTAVYNKYKVLGSKITITVNHQNGMEPGYFTCYLDDDGTASASNINQIIELGKIKQMIQYGGALTSRSRTVTCRYSARKMFGPKFYADTMIGDAASNPTEIAAYVIAYQNHAGFTTAQSPTFKVVIDYYAEFFELKETAQS